MKFLSREWLGLILVLPVLAPPSAATGGVVEDFNGGWADGGYAGVSTYNHAGVGIWESNDALVSPTNARSGDGVRFDDGATSPYLEFKGLDGSGMDGGVGTVSFWYRHWNGDGSTVSFALQYNINGGGWVQAGTGTVITQTVYQQFSSVLDLPDDNIRLRILTTTNNERLLIDDFEATGLVPPGPTLGFASAGSTSAEPDGTICIPVQLSVPGNASVSVAVTGGTAVNGFDYQLLTSGLTFTAANPVQQVQVLLLDNADPEPAETLVLGLSDALGAVVAGGEHVLTITDDDGAGVPDSGNLTILSANTTSGSNQKYEGPGDRIFQALDADVVAIQEFNVPDAGGRRAWVDRVFGTGFHYMVEPGADSIPCGVISRYPITASGQWLDTQVGNRDFAWATIDIPGAIDLHVISVHLHGSGGPTSRNIEAGIIVGEAASQFPATDYIALCGDFNTTSRTELAVKTFKTVFSDQHVPVDQNGESDTNQPRNKPYDWVMPNGPLGQLHQSLTVGGLDFPNGLVFDTRVWNPPPAPALQADSGAAQMQHMAVMKSYRLPLVTAMGTPYEWLESYGITSDHDNAELLDPDRDGFATWQEYVAGTDPTIGASVFEITRVEGELAVSITCATRAERRYVIEFADAVDPGSSALAWQSFTSAILGGFDETKPHGGIHTFVDDFGSGTSGGASASGWRFYRVGVSLL